MIKKILSCSFAVEVFLPRLAELDSGCPLAESASLVYARSVLVPQLNQAGLFASGIGVRLGKKP
jgi:hypothetical protein